MQKTNLNANLDKFFCDSSDFVERMLEEVTTDNSQPGLAAFIKQFFPCMLNHDVYGCNYIELRHIAMQVFSFLKKREPGQLKLRIYNPTLKKEGWASDYSILEIINDDMPFLIDSINEELHRLGISVYRIIHPLLSVKRDKKHDLLEVLPFDNKKSKPNESVLHFQITKIKTKELCKDVENSIINVLEQVRYAVNDWQPMVKKLRQAQEQLLLINYIDAEIIDFLKWLEDDNFTFLGYKSFTFDEHKSALPIAEQNSPLGVLKSDEHFLKNNVNNEVVNLINATDKTTHFIIGKLNYVSNVHRSINLDYIFIKTNHDKEVKIHFLIGLFTSVLNYQNATSIPIIRKKIQDVLTQSGFYPNSYSGKELITIINNITRDELFQISESELLTLVMEIYNLLSCPKLRLFTRKNIIGNHISCMIFMPSNAFSAEITEKIKSRLALRLNGKIVSTYMQLTSMKLAYINITIATSPNNNTETSLHQLELELQEISELWLDKLNFTIANRMAIQESKLFYTQFQNAFPVAYQERFTAENAINDIELILSKILQEKIVFKFSKLNINVEGSSLELKIYSWQDKITLSDIMPILDNMGFRIIDESVFEIKPDHMPDSILLHVFKLFNFDYDILNIDILTANIEDILLKIFLKQSHNGGLNKLVINAGLDFRQVNFIRALSKYIRQTRTIFNQHYVEEVLNKNANLTKLIVDLFYLKFNPHKKPNPKLITDKEKQIEDALIKVISSTEDQIIRKFIGASNAIIRTNYFQKDEHDLPKDYISFKFDSSKVPDLPLPKPYAEIFVYSNHFEAIHLRGGKVARGGIRWSDRSEDFRTEVLGLMRAQTTKNVVIVPVGSKGGFVVKATQEDLGKEAYVKEAKECYQNFLRGMLDITDNIIDNQVVPPQDVIRYDGDDPYLVVAADKGTATFSDLANSVSAEYNFWLGDAFASGGSMGYDHKIMGITARGAWISVVRHFNELEIPLNKDFTVIGIGDMAGDVFGNGMLLSKHIKLVGAFNHMHIFVDPDPDSKLSFQERNRLFKLPTSTWLDYNPNILSTGGRIFERNAKVLELTPEIKNFFNIQFDFATPEQLINILLTAKVDLLWNGGIGTYVKSENETHEQVADKNNDLIRVDGKDLRCKVIGEGGNVGMTQKGRIEYGLNGGKLNTDSIDNAAGVDCSDHEVNIKIVLSKAISSGKLTLTERNKILANMTNEIAELVLRDNFLQTQAISIAEYHKDKDLEKYARLISHFNSKKIFDANLESLPNAQEITRRKQLKLALVRPELAVLLAYSKMTIYTNLINSHLPDDPYFYNDLLLYFPKQLREKFKEEIANHPLKRNIIATFVTNSMVNRIGIYFFHFCQEDTGFIGCDIAQIYTIVRDLFDLRPLWLEIEASTCSVQEQLNLFIIVKGFLQTNILWFLAHVSQPINMINIMDSFRQNINDVAKNIEKIITPKIKTEVKKRIDLLVKKNISQSLASKIILLKYMSSACDISTVSNMTHLPTEIIGNIYFKIGEKFDFEWLHSNLEKLYSDSYWQNLAFIALRSDLRNLQIMLTKAVIKFSTKDQDQLELWLSAKSKHIQRYQNCIASLKIQETIDYSMLVIASKNIAALLV